MVAAALQSFELLAEMVVAEMGKNRWKNKSKKILQNWLPHLLVLFVYDGSSEL